MQPCFKCYMDVVDESNVGTLDSFVRDYSNFIKEFGRYMSLDEFAKEWTCLSGEEFGRLSVGDHAYTMDIKYGLLEIEIIETSYWSEEEELWTAVAKYVKPHPGGFDPNDEVFLYSNGETYSRSRTTEHSMTDLILRHPSMNNQGGLELWPTKLITTKTKEPSN